MANKNPSGMHNRVNAVLVNSRKEGRKLSGNLIELNENTYGELLEAFVKNALMNGIRFLIRLI